MNAWRVALDGLVVSLTIGFTVAGLVFLFCWYHYERPRGKSIIETWRGW